MANYGDFRVILEEFARKLRKIEEHTHCLVCNGGSVGSDVNVTNTSAIYTPIVTAIETNLTNSILTGENPTPHTTSAGANSSIPAGFKSIAIMKTSSAGTVTVTLSDATTFDLTAQTELFADGANQYYTLPAYAISTADGGTWKWHGIK